MTPAIANVAPRALGGATPLYVCSQTGCAEVVDQLLRYSGLSVECRMQADGSTPLMIAIYMASRSAGVEHMRIVEHLMQAGASLQTKDHFGRTALDWAPPEWRAALIDSEGHRGNAGGLAERLARSRADLASPNVAPVAERDSAKHPMRAAVGTASSLRGGGLFATLAASLEACYSCCHMQPPPAPSPKASAWLGP